MEPHKGVCDFLIIGRGIAQKGFRLLERRTGGSGFLFQLFLGAAVVGKHIRQTAALLHGVSAANAQHNARRNQHDNQQKREQERDNRFPIQLNLRLLLHLGDVHAVRDRLDQIGLLLRHRALCHAVHRDGKAVHDGDIAQLLHLARLLAVDLQANLEEGALRLIVIPLDDVFFERLVLLPVLLAHRVKEFLELLLRERGEIKDRLRRGGFLFRQIDLQLLILRNGSQIDVVILHQFELLLRVRESCLFQIRVRAQHVEIGLLEHIQIVRQLHRQIHLVDGVRCACGKGWRRTADHQHHSAQQG